MREIEFANGSLYHVFNRGFDRSVLFRDQTDFQRFYISLYLFNNIHFVNPGGNAPPSSLSDEVLDRLMEREEKRTPFVRIISFCLLSNHFHLFFEQLVDGGIPKFMHRVSMGYARYFNKRYERTGRLFSSSYKAVLIRRDAQLDHLPRYIHFNALDGSRLPWRDGRIRDWNRAQQILDSYPWSSHHVYAGRTQPLPLVDLDSVRRLFPKPSLYVAFLKRWSSRSLLPNFVTE